MMLDETTYRSKVLGSLLGKAVGGTLGQPYEGARGPLALAGYDPVPQGMMPNDDLDLQILWGCKLAAEWNRVVSYRNFAEAWKNCVAFPYDEYGVAIGNIRRGVMPPLSGKADNFFTDGLGGAIRSEIWAFLAPGDPALAARFARMDASVDHVGSGVDAEVFLAALESLAFVESDIAVLIDRALTFLPDDSKLKSAINETLLIAPGMEFRELHQTLLAKFGSVNFTDVVMNLPFMVAALIRNQGAFGRSICEAVNFGMDADCTGATVGAILGLIAPEKIEPEFLAPIGRELVVSKEITGIQPPPTLDGFVDLIAGLRGKVMIDDTEPVSKPCPPIPVRRGILKHFFAADYRKFPLFATEIPMERSELPGYLSQFTFGDDANAAWLLETDFELPQARMIHLLVNTPVFMAAGMDGREVLCTVGAPMCPAFHRAMPGTRADLDLAAGKHTLRIVLQARAGEAFPLFFGIAGSDNQFLDLTFRSDENDI